MLSSHHWLLDCGEISTVTIAIQHNTIMHDFSGWLWPNYTNALHALCTNIIGHLCIIISPKMITQTLILHTKCCMSSGADTFDN